MQLEKQPNLPYCETVRDLIEALKSLPDDLPLRQGFRDGVQPTVFNIRTDAFLEFEERDEDVE